MKTKHPAKFSDPFIPIFAEKLNDKKRVYDPFAGTGKIALIKSQGYRGKIYCSEIEPEWTRAVYGVDYWFIGDSADTPFIQDGFFDAICTSPTYGNRMADKLSKTREHFTYADMLGRELQPENTGYMQWGEEYRQKHIEIYKELYRVLENDGMFILNISDHIRKGKVVEVSKWHSETLIEIGMKQIDRIKVKTRRVMAGKNYEKRVDYENIFTFIKKR